MILNALLALGIVISSATQLLVPHLPTTLGELILALWIMLSLGQILAGEKIILTPALMRLFGFWVLLALFTFVGLIVGVQTKVLVASFILHDTVAYVLLALISCLIAAKPNASIHLRQCAWFVIGFANATFILQFAIGFGMADLANIHPWYWDRFRGWSQNPNQLALYCAIYGPVALHLATTSNRHLSKIAGFAGLILPVGAGLMTKSDTYVLTAILTCIIFVGLRLRTWFLIGAKSNIRHQIMILLLLSAGPIAIAMMPYGKSGIFSLVGGVTRDRGGLGIEETTNRRRELWSEALQNGLLSGSLGLGPGPHQELRPLNEPTYDDHPFEAHNTFLDIYTQGGLLAVGLLFWIGGSAAMFAWRANLDALLGLAITITFFAVPHLIIRHPVVWFALALCLVTGRPPLKSHQIAKKSGHGMSNLAPIVGV